MCHATQSPMLPESRVVNVVVTWEENCRAYPGRSYRRQVYTIHNRSLITLKIKIMNGDAVLFGISRTFTNLTFDGFFALVVNGIAGIDHSGHGRHPTLHIIKRRTVLSKCSFV